MEYTLLSDGQVQMDGSAVIAVPCVPTQLPELFGQNGELHETLDALWKTATEERGFEAKKGKIQQMEIASGQIVLLVGMGDKALKPADWRSFAESAMERAEQVKATGLTLVLPSAQTNRRQVVQQCVIGAEHKHYKFTAYHSKPQPGSCETVSVALVGKVTDSDREAHRFGVYQAKAMSMARDLVNEPPNELTPAEFGKRIVETLEPFARVVVELHGPDWIQEQKMNLLWAVGKGRTDAPPHFAHAVYTPPNADENTPRIMLVGKGMTFDAGGQISKPEFHSQGMKGDMAGLASLFAVFVTLVQAECSYIVHLVAPMADNCASGTAMRTDGIHWSYGRRKSVEIVHTDAEGRLILADAVTWGELEHKPDIVINLATLTGAQLVTHGKKPGTAMCTSDPLYDALKASSEMAGEDLERLTFRPEYLEALQDGSAADLRHMLPGGDKSASTAHAGTFISAFVEDALHAHVDGAGPLLGKKSGDLGTGWFVPTAFAFCMSEAPVNLAAQNRSAA